MPAPAGKGAALPPAPPGVSFLPPRGLQARRPSDSLLQAGCTRPRTGSLCSSLPTGSERSLESLTGDGIVFVGNLKLFLTLADTEGGFWEVVRCSGPAAIYPL